LEKSIRYLVGSDDNQPISHSASGASPINVRFTSPLARTMMTALDFIAVLAEAVKRWQEINLLVGGSTNGDKNMSCRQINSLVKAVKEEKITKMMKMTANVVVVAAASPV
jgi:hypothetical protein